MSWSWVFSFSGQLGSEKPTAGQALVNQFSLRAAPIKMNEYPGIFQNGSLPLLQQEAWGDFSPVFTVGIWNIPGGKTHSTDCD